MRLPALLLVVLITPHDVARHRFRKDDLDETTPHNYSYDYEIRVVRDGVMHKIPVCFNAFKSLFGITNMIFNL